jgi:hypothetical protein
MENAERNTEGAEKNTEDTEGDKNADKRLVRYVI